ncbi:MAG: hypothetical protein RR348_01685 [Clostridia bacterium]
MSIFNDNIGLKLKLANGKTKKDLEICGFNWCLLDDDGFHWTFLANKKIVYSSKANIVTYGKLDQQTLNDLVDLISKGLFERSK